MFFFSIIAAVIQCHYFTPLLDMMTRSLTSSHKSKANALPQGQHAQRIRVFCQKKKKIDVLQSNYSSSSLSHAMHPNCLGLPSLSLLLCGSSPLTSTHSAHHLPFSACTPDDLQQSGLAPLRWSTGSVPWWALQGPDSCACVCVCCVSMCNSD